MFDFVVYENHSLYGVIYHFHSRGDGIPMHDHPEHRKHNLIVARGSVEVYGPEKTWSIVLGPGDVFDLEDQHHPHEIAALENDTKLFGIYVHGKPDEDVNAPEELLRGTDLRPLKIPLSTDPRLRT